MTGTEARLARIRGRALPRSHKARTIAALASNPGCARRAILDAAGADKQRIAAYAGFPAPFGQSRFALARGNAFEAQVKADGGAELLTLLREHLNLPIPEAHYDDLSEVGGSASPDLRHARTRSLLARAASANSAEGTMFDHPLLRLEVGGRHAFLEPDLIAFQLHGKFQVAAELCGPTRRWRSLTPYLPVRHRKRESLKDYLTADVRTELGYRGLPPASVTPVGLGSRLSASRIAGETVVRSVSAIRSQRSSTRPLAGLSRNRLLSPRQEPGGSPDLATAGRFSSGHVR